MIDLHSHLLPGVDDGARTVDDAVAALHAIRARGIIGVCLTPHVTALQANEGVPARHDQAFRQLTEGNRSGVVLYRGAEVMLERPLAQQVAERRDMTLAGSRYLLVEFPRLVSEVAVDLALKGVVSLGLVPVLAHPERYAACSLESVRRWRSLGARMQVDAATLLAHSRRGSWARQLVAEGLADILAGDNHGDERSVADGTAMLRQHGGESQAELLGSVNPRAILDDGDLEPVPPLALRRTWRDRLRRLLDGDSA